jgi:hypothetical protein
MTDFFKVNNNRWIAATARKEQVRILIDIKVERY